MAVISAPRLFSCHEEKQTVAGNKMKGNKHFCRDLLLILFPLTAKG